MAEEITTKKIEDLGENMEPADADVFLFGASGGNIIKKIKWGNLMKKLRTLLFVNNRTTTEEGFGLDARQGKLIQDELDQLNTKIRGRSMHISRGDAVQLAKSGMVEEGAFSDNIAVDISKMGFKKAPIGIPVSKGYLEPRINSITTGTLNLGFYNAGPGNHSGECKVILIELY